MGGSPPASASLLFSLVHPCVSLHLAVFYLFPFIFRKCFRLPLLYVGVENAQYPMTTKGLLPLEHFAHKQELFSIRQPLS